MSYGEVWWFCRPDGAASLDEAFATLVDAGLVAQNPLSGLAYMMDENVVTALRAAGQHKSPTDTARMFEVLVPEGLTQSTMVFYLKRAFPEIPLKTIFDAQGWAAVGPGPISDAEFDEMLRPWWPVPGLDAAGSDG